jgi:VWFA-related protein
MMRFLAVFLVSGLTAMAQDSPAISIIDAVALDAAGNPVTGLTAADFEITANERKVEVLRFTAFDAVAHTAKTTTTQPALELTPDQIHRTTVVIIDDLCLSADALREAKVQVHQFVERLLAPGDEAAILRTSGGSTRSRRITSNAGELTAIIDSTEPLGGELPPATCAAAVWNAAAYAANGLASVAGRKAIVVMSAEDRGPAGNAAAEIERRADASMTAFYQTSSSAPAFASATGGAASVTLDRVAGETGAFYSLAVATAAGAVQVKVLRPGVTLRARRRSSPLPARPDFAVPPDDTETLDAALNSPFDAASIGITATTLFTNTAAEGTVIAVLCHLDVRDLSYLRDEQGRYHLAFDIGAQSVVEAGRATQPLIGSKELRLTAEEYQRAVEDGLVVNLRLGWGAGPRDVRVAVADHRSGRAGSANAFTPSNSVESGNFFLSGVALLGNGSAKQSPAVRLFRGADKFSYSYTIFNAMVDGEGRSRVQVQSRLIAGGRTAFTGTVSSVTFDPTGEPHRRQVSGHIQLDPSISPGRYIFEVTAVDQLASQPRRASQFIDFIVER